MQQRSTQGLNYSDRSYYRTGLYRISYIPLYPIDSFGPRFGSTQVNINQEQAHMSALRLPSRPVWQLANHFYGIWLL